MNARINEDGKELLFLEGASKENFKNIDTELIINFKEKGIYIGLKYIDTYDILIIKTLKGDIRITFSLHVLNVIPTSYCKDQLVVKIIKDECS